MSQRRDLSQRPRCAPRTRLRPAGRACQQGRSGTHRALRPFAARHARQPVMADVSADVTGIAPGALAGVSSRACCVRAGNISRNAPGVITAAADGFRVAAWLAFA
jgi:hypothetical protein